MIEWKTWDESVIRERHGDVYYYRDLYDGKHDEIFPRAKHLIEQGEITAQIEYGKRQALNVQTPYVIANIAKLIPEVPAMLVGRSIGRVKTSVKNERSGTETADMIDGPEGNELNNTVEDPQQEVLEQIEKNSRLMFSHWTNIVQQQTDGGLVGVPIMDGDTLRIDFKQRDVYFPHDDGKGADLAYYKKVDEKEYVHVYRERVEKGNLTTENMVYRLNGTEMTKESDEFAREFLSLEPGTALTNTFNGRSQPFIVYWANEATFRHPLGNSCLKNQGAKQDEINWTLTRSALTFERNGKPRISVTSEIFQALQQASMERYGTADKIDHRDLEITTFDESGQAMQYHQIDVSKIGDLQWVKDLTKLMFMETKTSEKAVDFYMEGNTAAQSGVAKFYDLFLSLVKAEQIQGEYVYFLQQLFENCLWLLNAKDPQIVIEEPVIELREMVPMAKKETLEENAKAYNEGVQSIQTTVAAIHPDASDEWRKEEINRLTAEESAYPIDDTEGDEE